MSLKLKRQVSWVSLVRRSSPGPHSEGKKVLDHLICTRVLSLCMCNYVCGTGLNQGLKKDHGFRPVSPEQRRELTKSMLGSSQGPRQELTLKVRTV